MVSSNFLRIRILYLRIHIWQNYADLQHRCEHTTRSSHFCSEPISNQYSMPDFPLTNRIFWMPPSPGCHSETLLTTPGKTLASSQNHNDKNEIFLFLKGYRYKKSILKSLARAWHMSRHLKSKLKLLCIRLYLHF